jgi:hypothetical protein
MQISIVQNIQYFCISVPIINVLHNVLCMTSLLYSIYHLYRQGILALCDEIQQYHHRIFQVYFEYDAELAYRKFSDSP